MIKNSKVRLTKIISKVEQSSYPYGYWSEGFLYEDITIGKPIQMTRFRRNRQTLDEPEAVECMGNFTSRPVS